MNKDTGLIQVNETDTVTVSDCSPTLERIDFDEAPSLYVMEGKAIDADGMIVAVGTEAIEKLKHHNGDQDHD